MKRKPIYVELPIQSDINTLWEITQNPNLHEQWDLRFSSITYLPRESEEQPQEFSYKTKIGFGFCIEGWGKSIGKVHTKDRTSVSSLQFGTDQNLSIIKEGGGYWEYKPQENATLFLTKYNYKTRFGWLGKYFDFLIFRPLISWATAISFDVLKRWVETGDSPSSQYFRLFSSWLFIYFFSFVWIYHGLTSKLIHQHPAELSMMQMTFSIKANEASVLVIVTGMVEVIIGLLWLGYKNRGLLYRIQIVIFLIFAIVSSLTVPSQLFHPFNPITFNMALLVISIVGLTIYKNIPTAKNCKRKQEGVKNVHL
ncbi:DoxX-like family protein [Virgibacillus salexigens]|uniref:DoxX-like family protein n=2 Tax=Virgibacillus TaxID=84406 RepID=A0A024QDP3_9BACI|nr:MULTISPECIES: DoxX-like family protein [Virgibacillus]MYL42459.1 hypothetical protein [Virgibacillus massiliensis]GGJ42300.1 membrane protein [Virgibacillus kapii]CDQ40325.1 hypothetical protein BN990_02647 [Virgibacillus massiliensis]